MLGLALLLALGLVALAIGVTFWTAAALARPRRKTFAWARSRGRPTDPGGVDGLAWRAWTIDGGGGEVWDVAGLEPGGPVVIVTHGWGDSRYGSLSRLGAIARLASRVVLWDLPGHGDAPGWCALGLREGPILDRLIDQVLGGRASRERAAASGAVLFGSSLGAGVSIAVASTRGDVRAVIAESPYRLARTPAANVLRLMSMPSGRTLDVALWMVGLVSRGPGAWKGFDRAGLAARLGCPLLVVHGDADEISPFADGESIAASAREGRLARIAGAGHNNLWSDPAHADACVRAIAGFLRPLDATIPSHGQAGDG